MNNSKDRNCLGLDNNKGIAMVTIIIAVAFISIIGSALLYISYTNFQMKVLNLNSKENFYETDGELVDITSKLRNAMNQKSPDNISVVLSTPIQEIDNGDGTKRYEGTYDLSTLLGLTSTTVTKGEDTFTYDVSGKITKAQPNSNLTVYTLEDIGVEQKSKDGYVNTVRTNLELKILTQNTSGKGSKGLGECSMLCDSRVYVKGDSNFTFLTLLGDSYFSSYEYGSGGTADGTFPGLSGSGTYTKPGKYNADAGSSHGGLELAKNVKVNFEAKYLAVFGDLVLRDNSCLVISGAESALTVYGDIYLMDNSTLICNGTIYQPSSILPGRGVAPCVYSGQSGSGHVPNTATAADLDKHLYYTHLGGKTAPNIADAVEDQSFIDVCELMNLNNASADDDGITHKIITNFDYKDSDGTHHMDILHGLQNPPKKPGGGEIKTIESKYYDKDCGVAFVKGGGDVGHPGEWENYLVFVYDGLQNNVTYDLKGSAINTTLVSRVPIHLNVQDGIYFSKMGQDVSDYLTVRSTPGGTQKKDKPYYDEDIHDFELELQGQDTSGNWLKSATGNKYSAGDFIHEETDGFIINLFNYGINGGGGGKKYINSVNFSNYVKDND